jgi:hypothetical protein
VVVFEVSDDELIATIHFFDLKNQTKLLVHPHGILVLPLAFEFLEMKRFHGAQVVLIIGRAYVQHESQEGASDAESETSVVLGIVVDPL